MVTRVCRIFDESPGQQPNTAGTTVTVTLALSNRAVCVQITTSPQTQTHETQLQGMLTRTLFHCSLFYSSRLTHPSIRTDSDCHQQDNPEVQKQKCLRQKPAHSAIRLAVANCFAYKSPLPRFLSVVRRLICAVRRHRVRVGVRRQHGVDDEVLDERQPATRRGVVCTTQAPMHTQCNN